MSGVSESRVDEPFEAHIAPLRDSLGELLDASDHMRDEWGFLPAADSLAMAELAAEAEFSGRPPWGDDPVAAAHNTAGLLLFGGSDCARAAVRLLTTGPTPVYADTVLARGCLELMSRAWWLLEPVGVRLRVARGMNERLFGLAQQRRLPLEDDTKTRAEERTAGLMAEAARLGFAMVRAERKAPRYLEEVRPGQTELIRRLLSVGDDASLGEALYGLFSAVAHGTTFGLSSSVTADAPDLPKTPGVTWGAVYTSSLGVVTVLTAIVLGTAEAYRRRNTLFGWTSEVWSKAVLSALGAARRSFPQGEG